MNELLATIIKCVEGDLSFQPDLKQEVAKTLLSLLKVRKQENYLLSSIMILGQLEEKFDSKAKMIKKLDEKGLGFASIHESKIAAGTFPDLSESEVNEIKTYLEGLISHREETLEQYMSQELGITAKESYDPDDYTNEGPKLMATALAMFNSGNLEDFTIMLQEEVSKAKILEIIKRFYVNRGYDVRENLSAFFLSKEKDELMVNMSYFGDKVMVSVIDMNRW